MSEYPYVRAAFINAIREEATKEEACDFLQEEWNKSCALRDEVCALKAQLEEARATIDRLTNEIDMNSRQWNR